MLTYKCTRHTTKPLQNWNTSNTANCRGRKGRVEEDIYPERINSLKDNIRRLSIYTKEHYNYSFNMEQGLGKIRRKEREDGKHALTLYLVVTFFILSLNNASTYGYVQQFRKFSVANFLHVNFLC